MVYKKFKALPTILWMMLIFYLSHQPASVINHTGIGFVDYMRLTLEPYHGDKLVHATVYFVLALTYLYALSLPNKPVLALLLAVAYGLSDEIHQLAIPGRTFEWLDLMADTMGAFLGCLLYFHYRRKWKRRLFMNAAPAESMT